MNGFPGNSPFFSRQQEENSEPWIPTPEELDAIEIELVRPPITATRLEDIYTELKDLLAWIESEATYAEDNSGTDNVVFFDELQSRVSRLLP